MKFITFLFVYITIYSLVHYDETFWLKYHFQLTGNRCQIELCNFRTHLNSTFINKMLPSLLGKSEYLFF